MERKVWSIEKARKHIRICSRVVIIAGIFSLLLSIDDFLLLGQRTSVFVFPYLFNIISFIFSIFQIYVGLAIKDIKPWARNAVFCILAMRLFFSFYDHLELIVSIFMLFYLVFVLRPSKAGWLFRNN